MSIDTKTAEDICTRLNEVSHRLKEHEENFVTSLAERFEMYGERTLVSQKQFDWLVDLEAKYL